MSTSETDQRGRVAVITGASSGIGAATARALAADGHRVALLARRADRVQALADELGSAAIAIEGDVTDRDSMVAAAERVQGELGGCDILVNNAGVMLLAPFSSDQTAETRQMVETNLLGAMTATEVFLDQLRDGGGDLAQRLVRVPAPGAPAGRPGDRRRAGRGCDRAHRPHHRRRRQAGRGADVQGARDHGGRHRRGHRLRCRAAAARVAQRDPRPADGTAALRGSV
jgi:NAD(P)-dependent dehydrogenase (short-subunit alcohol dehydrogenase family)